MMAFSAKLSRDVSNETDEKHFLLFYVFRVSERWASAWHQNFNTRGIVKCFTCKLGVIFIVVNPI